MPYTFADAYSQLYQFYKAEGALDQFPEEIKGRFQFCLSSLYSKRAQILILKSHKFRLRCNTSDGSAATYWKSAGHGPPAPLSENCKYHLEAVAGKLEFYLMQESSRRLSVWNWWLLASFILFAALFTVLTVFLVSHDFH